MPVIDRQHTRNISIIINQSKLTKNKVIHASSCRFKINCGAIDAFAAGRVPDASFSAKSLAAEKNPIRISGLVIFCQAAVLVIMTNHVRGSPVIPAYFNLPDLKINLGSLQQPPFSAKLSKH